MDKLGAFGVAKFVASTVYQFVEAVVALAPVDPFVSVAFKVDQFVA